MALFLPIYTAIGRTNIEEIKQSKKQGIISCGAFALELDPLSL